MVDSVRAVLVGISAAYPGDQDLHGPSLNANVMTDSATDDHMMNIKCRCGLLEVGISDHPIAQFFCHCDDCQAVHGAAYVPISMYRADAVRIIRGNPSTWALKTTPRTSCRECGTRVFAEVPGYGVRGVSALLLPALHFKPLFHVQCQFAMLPIRDLLPHFKSLPARFGGSDEVVEW